MLDDVDEPFQLQCNHVFCTVCILNWLTRKRVCPLCGTVPSSEFIPEEWTAPADDRYYDVSGRPEDFTSEAELVDAELAQVENLNHDADEDQLATRLLSFLFTLPVRSLDELDL